MKEVQYIPKFLLLSILIVCSKEKVERNIDRYFLIGIHGESTTFIAMTNDTDVIGLAASELKLPENDRLLHPAGPIVIGNGGYNTNWSWQLDPSKWSLEEVSIELCDANPSYIEANLDSWFSSVGQYCPWAGYIKKDVTDFVRIK